MPLERHSNPGVAALKQPPTPCFEVQQVTLQVQPRVPTPEPAQAAIAADHPVTRHDYGRRIPRHHLARRPERDRLARLLCQPPVGARLRVRDPAAGLQRPTVELRRVLHVQLNVVEPLVFTLKIAHEADSQVTKPARVVERSRGDAAPCGVRTLLACPLGACSSRSRNRTPPVRSTQAASRTCGNRASSRHTRPLNGTSRSKTRAASLNRMLFHASAISRTASASEALLP